MNLKCLGECTGNQIVTVLTYTMTKRKLARLCLGVILIVIGTSAVGVPVLINSVLLVSNARLQLEPLQPNFAPPLAINFELRHANDEVINASSVLLQYTGTGGPVLGIGGSPIRLSIGSQLLWGGRVYDSRGLRVALVDVGLFYFVPRNDCDESNGLSCYTEPTLVATTKTDHDGRFGFPAEGLAANEKLPAWTLPNSAGDVIIVYADLLTSQLTQRQKNHYAIKSIEPPVGSGVWIDDLRVIDFGQNYQYASVDSGSISFSIDLPTGETAYLAVGECGNDGCFSTPPQESKAIRQVVSGLVNVFLPRAHYLFYVSNSSADPFKSKAAQGDVFLVGVFDTLHIVAPSEYALLGLVPMTVGLVLLLSFPLQVAERLQTIRELARKIRLAATIAPLKTVMICAVISRLFVFSIAIAASSIFGEPLYCQSCWDVPVPFVNLFARYDSGYYVDIALRGYSNMIVPRWEFFPGYPVTIGIFGRILTVLSPIPLELVLYVSGFVISNLAFFGCIYYMFKLSSKVLYDNQLAFYSALCLAFCPAGIFLSATYSESLFLFLMLGSLYYWRVGRKRESALLGFLQALTRPVGILLVVPYFIELLCTEERRKAVDYLPVFSVVLGFVSFLIFSELVTGTPFAQFEADRLYWGTNLIPTALLSSAIDAIDGNPIIIPYLALAVGGMLTSIVFPRNKAETAIDVYGLALLITYPYTGLISIARYSITLISAYWGYARWMRRYGTIVLTVLLVLLAIGVGLFVNWYNFY